MLPSPKLPESWRLLLETLRPTFARSRTFTLFTILATGLVARTSRRTVVGMLTGSGCSAVASFHAACRFFSHAVWDPDRLGLALARLIVTRLLAADEAITVVVDDTLFRRWGRRVHAAFWTHDGAAQGPDKIGLGNRWVIAGIVVRLPFCPRPVCLPVLFRLWAGKGTASPVQLAADLLKLLAAEFGDRKVHGVGDAAYHGKALLGAGDNVSFTTRLPTKAALYDLAPPRTGKRGRPRLKGQSLGRLTEIAATTGWRPVRVDRYEHTGQPAHLAEVPAIWYGSFGNTAGRLILVRETDSSRPYGLALFTTDLTSAAEQIITRYAWRWSIEVAIFEAKRLLGVGQARNRLRRAVERTVPFGFCVQTLVILWYATAGHHPDDLAGRRAAEPWYGQKTEPAFEDMLAKLRRTHIAARFTIVPGQPPDPDIIRDYQLACEAAAA